MKRWLLFLWLPLGMTLWAQAPVHQEVEMEATSGSKVGISLAPPVLDQVDAASAEKDFTAVVLRDLEEAGPFAVIRKNTPASAEDGTFPVWAQLGTQWLVIPRLTRRTADELEVNIQVKHPRSGKSVFSKKYTGKDSVLRRIAHTVADDLVGQLTGDRGVAGTRVVFVKQIAPSVKEIFQVDRDGANVLQLTRHGSLTISPTVAPDGRLAYVTYKGGAPEIWGQKRPGGAHVKLYPTSVGKPEGNCYSPAWSPDGKRLAFIQGDRRGNTDIMVLDADSGRVRRLTDSNCLNSEPCWNPAGTQIAFTSDRAGGPQVYLMEEDGSNVRRLTHEGNYNASPSWSPTGAMIAYVSRFEGKFDLFVYKLGEGKSYQITKGVQSSESPSWSPDERRLVYTLNTGRGLQLFTTDLSGATVRSLMDLSGCQSPKWTRSR